MPLPQNPLWGCSQGVNRSRVSRLRWGRIHFQAQSQDYWQDLVPCGLLNWGPQSLAGSWPGAPHSSMPCGALHRATYNMEAGFWRREGGTDRQTQTWTQRESSAVTCYHLHCFLLARIKSLQPVFTQGETSQMVTLIKGKLLPHNSSPQWNAAHYLFLFSFKKKFVTSFSSFFNV